MDDLTLFISPFRFQEFNSMTAFYAFKYRLRIQV
jgi:hypothetical protein